MANKIVAQGQMTIVDMHDMPPVQGRLTSNQPKIVVLSSDGSTQSPNWATSNLIIKAELYKAGDSSDLISAGNSAIKGITWYYTLGSQAETTTAPGGVAAAKDGSSGFNNKLTINQRLLTGSSPSLKIRAIIDFEYSGTAQRVPVSVEIDFALANNGVAGIDSYSAFLSNTSAVIPCNSSGAVSVSAGVVAPTQAVVYKGGTLRPVTLSTTPKSGSTLPSGVTITQGATSDTVNINFAYNTNMGGVDSGTITLVATCDGKSFDQIFSWSKSKQGDVGQNATSYWLVPNARAIIKKWNGSAWIYDPTSIIAAAKSQTGTANMVDYSGRFKIQLYNGTTAIADAGFSVSSSADETSRSLVIPTSKPITHGVVTLYKAGGVTTILDEERVIVVEESKKAISTAVYSDNDTIRNGSGTATIKVAVYKDGVDVTNTSGTSKQWYKGSSAMSGKTADNVVVTSSDISSSQMFSCRVTIDGATYIDSIVIYDVSDPIQGTVLSSNGEVFKNGLGSTNLTFSLWRNGSPLDEPGTQFAYCWHKYDNTGVEDTAWSPVATATPALASAGIPVAVTTAAVSGSTVVVDDVTFIRAGYVVFIGAITTPYTVTNVNSSTKTLTFSAAPAATATGTTIRLTNYKTITVTNAQIAEKATFMCELVQ